MGTFHHMLIASGLILGFGLPATPTKAAPKAGQSAYISWGGFSKRTLWASQHYRLIQHRLKGSPVGRLGRQTHYSIALKGRTIHRIPSPTQGRFWFLGQAVKSPTQSRHTSGKAAPRLGQDITGDGKPNLVLFWSSGGACGCSVTVFTLGNRLRRSLELNNLCQCPRFIDRDRDGKLELSVRYRAFGYWCQGRETVKPLRSPPIVYRYRGGRYHATPSSKSRRAPTSAVLRLLARGIRNRYSPSRNGIIWARGCAPVALWSRMLTYLHQGHAAAAWRLLHLTWPQNLPGRKTFRRAFLRRMQTRRAYYHALRSLNGRLL